VPVTQGINLYGVLQGKGVPARIVVFPEENHWVLKPQASVLWWKEVFGWLDRWLAAGEGKSAGRQIAAAGAAAAAGAEDEVRAAEARRFAAMVRADVTELGSLLADDLTYVHSTGKVEDRAAFLAGISAGAFDYEMIEPAGAEVRLHGDVAIATGRADVRVVAGGDRIETPLRYTAVYVKRDGRWLLSSWQSTRAGS
jgi:ketosteroid isomerase-like protein